VRLPPVFLLVVACSGTTSGDRVSGDDDDDVTVATDTPGQTTETGAPTDTGTVATGGPGALGVVVDGSGVPLADYRVLACNAATCFTKESEDDGSFVFDFATPMRVAVKTHEDLYTTPRMGAALEPINVTDRTVELGTLWVPDLPAGVRVGDADTDPQDLAVGDGLELTLNRADLVPDFGVFLYDIAARQLPAAHVPIYEDLGVEEVIAVYAVHPFATGSTSPIGIRVPCTLPAGTEVYFRHIDEIDGTFSAPAVGRCDGSHATTDPGEGVLRLTHLVITAP
jgi:hypothetical protein